MIIVVVFLVGAVSVVAARSIVAEADAHRLHGNDRWKDPICESCGGRLAFTMRRCVESNHPQRLANALTLVLTVAVSGSLTVVAPSAWLIPAYVWFGWLMILLTITDIDTRLLPNRILFPGTAVTAVLLFIGSAIDGALADFGRGVLAGCVYFGVMLVLALIARGGLGFGDVKLAFAIGLVVGTLSWGHLTFTILWAFLFAGIMALVLLITRRVGRKDSIPFGPFMTVSAVATLIVGSGVLDWYPG